MPLSWKQRTVKSFSPAGSDGKAVYVQYLDLIDDAGNAQATFSLSGTTFTNDLITPSYTFATLPTPSLGRMAVITDGNGLSVGDAAAGGGSQHVLLWYDGANWAVAAVPGA